MRKWLPLVLGLLIAASTAAAGGKLQIYPGAWSPVTPADLATHPLKPEAYTESWFFMVQGADGLWLFLHFGISNMQPLSDFDGALETTVIRNGAVTFVKDNIGKKQVRHSTTTLDLALGKSTLKAVPEGYVLHVEQKGVTVDLVVKPLVAGVKPGRSIYPNGEFYQLDLAAPRASVSGSLVLDGKTLPVAGQGYFDHSLQDYPAHKMADRLYSFRGFSAEGGVNYLNFVTPKGLGGEDMPALLVLKGNEVAARLTSMRMTGAADLSDKSNDYTYPSKWSFEGRDGENPVSGTIVLGKKLQEQNAADDFNVFERTLIKAFVANPMLYRHAGTFDFTVGGKTPVHVTGEGVAEIVVLRQ
jgi:hypothetical protein